MQSHARTSGLTSAIESMKKPMSGFAVKENPHRTSAVTEALCGNIGIVWSQERNREPSRDETRLSESLHVDADANMLQKGTKIREKGKLASLMATHGPIRHGL